MPPEKCLETDKRAGTFIPDPRVFTGEESTMDFLISYNTGDSMKYGFT